MSSFFILRVFCNIFLKPLLFYIAINKKRLIHIAINKKRSIHIAINKKRLINIVPTENVCVFYLLFTVQISSFI